MVKCNVKWCEKNSKTSSYVKDGITFHRYPKSPNIKKKWIDATQRGDSWFPSKSSVICSRHFTEDNFLAMNQRRRLMDPAVPTVYLLVLEPNPSCVGTCHVLTVPEPEDLDTIAGESDTDKVNECDQKQNESPSRKRHLELESYNPCLHHICRKTSLSKNY